MSRKYTEDDVLVTLDTFSKIAGKTKETVDYLEYEINEGVSAPLVIVVRANEAFLGSTITAKSKVDGREYSITLESTISYIKVKSPGEYVVTNSHNESIETAIVGEPLKEEVYFTDFYGSIDVTVDDLLLGETIEATNGENTVEALAESSTTTLNVFRQGEWTVGIKGTELIEKKQVQLSETGESKQVRLEVTESTPTITVTLVDELKEENVVCKKEEYSRIRTPKDGVVKFFIPEQGEWVVHLEASELIREQVSVSENKNYDVALDLEDLGTPVLIVTSKADYVGHPIKVSRGDVVMERSINPDGMLFFIPVQGEWTISSDDYPDKTRTVLINENKVYRVKFGPTIFGIKVTQGEADPQARIEPLEDLVGLKPISVNKQNAVVDYGDMSDTFLFEAMNNPVLLSIDGREEIELDPYNYSQKRDGSGPAPTANNSSNYNLFNRIDKLYLYMTVSQGYEYYYISQEKVDENYTAVGFTREDDSEADAFYVGSFLGSFDNSNRLRSTSGVNIRNYTNYTNFAAAAKKNGNGYYLDQFAEVIFLQVAFLMMMQNYDCENVIGEGRNLNSGSENNRVTDEKTGFANQSGPIAYDISSKGIKFMHMEDLWFNIGASWIEGIINQNLITYTRLKPPYISSANGGTTTYNQVNEASKYSGYIDATYADNKYGRVASSVTGSMTTYECARWYLADNLGNTGYLYAWVRETNLFMMRCQVFDYEYRTHVARLTYLPPAK